MKNIQQDYFRSLGTSEKTVHYNHTKSVVKKYFFHWPLYVIAITLSLTIATVYLTAVKPEYEVRASILIKDNKKTADPQVAMFQEIGLTTSSEGVENEIEIIKSKQIIGQVVKDLQLWVTYKEKDGLLSEDLYKDSPVKLVSFNHAINLDHKNIDIVIKDDKSFLLKASDGSLKELPFKNSYKSNWGVWKLEPTKTFSRYKNAAIKIAIGDSEKTTLAYQKKIDAVLPNKLSTSIELSVNDKVPQRGKDILNYLILNYNLSSAIEKNSETKQALDFLDQRIASLTGELSVSEKGIEGFKQSKGLTDISSETQVRLQNMQLNDNNLNDVNIKLNIIEGIEKYINSSQNTAKAPATLGITDPVLSNSIEKLSLLQLQHDRLAAIMPETNPDFDPINSQIKTTKAAIRENVKNIKIGLEGVKNKLQSYNSRFEASIKTIPSDEREYISIKRQQSSKEALYTYLLQKREEVSLKYASNLKNNRVVDQAYSAPPQDRTMISYFAALLCGLLFPTGLIYGRNSLNNRITNIHEITNSLKAPVVCELQYENTKSLISIKDSNVVSEQLKALRVKLHYLHNKKESGRVTLLTSSIPREGKSFVSANLGIALASAYRKTVILELDMRKPKIAQAFGLPRAHYGISEYLNNRATKESIIQHSGSISNLDIISCGSIVNNPSELLEKSLLKDLLVSLRNQYDDIIIDSPPIHLVPDAVILSRLADITLYVIRQGFTDKTELDFINQLFDQNQLHNINIIFNGIERIKYGYGYKYDEEYYNNTRSNLLVPIFSDFQSRF